MTLDTYPFSEPGDDGGAIDQLVYRSLSRDGAESGLQMSDILDQARVGNARDDITGVLTVVDGWFVQIIEGPSLAIDNLMGRLARDPRHTDLRLIERRASNARLFGDWDMVSPRLAAAEISLLALLMQDEDAGLDAYAEGLMRAVAQQEAVLEGRRSPRSGSMDAVAASVSARQYKAP